MRKCYLPENQFCLILLDDFGTGFVGLNSKFGIGNQLSCQNSTLVDDISPGSTGFPPAVIGIVIAESKKNGKRTA